MVEIHATDFMGNGMFATRDIPRDTQHLVEFPVLVIPPSTSRDPDEEMHAFCTAFQRLPESTQEILDGLYCNTDFITPARHVKVRHWYKNERITDTNGDILKGKSSETSAKPKLSGLKFPQQQSPDGNHRIICCGVFSLYSHSNHSCI